MTGTVNTPVKYPIDVTGVHPDNRIENEIHRVSPIDRVITPKMIKFYAESLNVRTASRELVLGQDYKLEDLDPVLTEQTGKAVMQSIVLLDNTLIGEVMITYQCYGTGDTFTREYIGDLIAKAQQDKAVYFKDLVGLPDAFPPSEHRHDIEHTSGWEGAIQVMDELVLLIGQLKTTRDHKLYTLVEQFKREVTERLERNTDDIQEARSVIGSINQLDKRVNQIINDLRAQVESLTDSSEFLAKMKALENKLQAEIGRVSREQNANLIQANQEIDRKLTDLGNVVDEKLPKATYERDIQNYVLQIELTQRLLSYVPTNTYRTNETANRKYVDDNLNLKASKTEVTNQINAAKRQIDYSWLLNIPSSIIHQRHTDNQNIDQVLTHGLLSIKAPTGTLPTSADVSSGIHLLTQTAGGMNLKHIQTLTDSQGKQWTRIHKGGRYQPWISQFANNYAKSVGMDINRLTPGIYEMEKSGREWAGLVGTIQGDNGTNSYDASILDYSTVESKNQLITLGQGYHYIRTNDDPNGANKWVNEQLITTSSIDRIYPGLSTMKATTDGLGTRITNNTNNINSINTRLNGLLPVNNGSVTLFHQEGRGAYAAQYTTKAPVYVETRGSVARDTYHPFIKGKMRDNGKYGAVCSFGYTTYQGASGTDGFGRGIINIQEDNGKQINWSFEHDGEFRSTKLGLHGRGQLINDGESYKLNDRLKANDLMVTSDRRLKENIKPIENALQLVKQLNGYTFNYIEDKRPSVGVIAQEVEVIFPELVSNTEVKSVGYNGLIGLLISAVNELQEENNQLKSTIVDIEMRLSQLEEVKRK